MEKEINEMDAADMCYLIQGLKERLKEIQLSHHCKQIFSFTLYWPLSPRNPKP